MYSFKDIGDEFLGKVYLMFKYGFQTYNFYIFFKEYGENRIVTLYCNLVNQRILISLNKCYDNYV